MFDRLSLVWKLWGIWSTAEARAQGDPMAAKNILASKTFWFNVLALVLGFAQEQGLFALIPEPYGPAALALGNIILRAVTTQPVTLPGK